MWSKRSFGSLACTAGLVALALTSFACGGDGEEPHVDAVLNLQAPMSIADGEPIHVNYSWEPAADFNPPAQDYRVFVHLIDVQGNILAQDDHYPPEPTSQWRAGEPEQYERWFYIPRLEIDQVRLVIGLHDDELRAMLPAGAAWTDAIEAQTIGIRVEDMSGVPVYMDGWHPAEKVNESMTGSWRWSEGTARVVFTNPARAAVLHLHMHGPYFELGEQSQTVAVSVEGQQVWQGEIASDGAVRERIEISQAMLGEKDWVEVAVTVAPTLTPTTSNGDQRILGLQMFQMYLSPS